MDLLPIFLAGPLVAAVGIVAVFFVMRRRAVDKKSMYSARRSQIERKVRAARQRTLAPTGRRSKDETAMATAPAMEFGMEAKPAAPTATWATPPAAAQETWASPPASAPAASPGDTWATPAASAPAAPIAPTPVQQPWDVGPTAPAPAPAYGPPPEPAYAPPPTEPAYSPPEPAYSPPPVDSSWTPAPAETIPPPMETAASVPAGGQASWEVVGQAAPAAEPETDKKSKKDKDKEKSATGAWQLASGMAPGEEADDEVDKRPSATMAIAQYAILVVGLVMVLIGVIVMIGNSSQ
jgi:hypothetical protein